MQVALKPKALEASAWHSKDFRSRTLFTGDFQIREVQLLTSM